MCAGMGLVFIQAESYRSGNLFTIGTKQPIPNAEYISIITICIGQFKMMVYMVQSRGDKYQAKDFFHCWRELVAGVCS